MKLPRFLANWKFDSAQQSYLRAVKQCVCGIELAPNDDSARSSLWTVKAELLRLDSLRGLDENVIRAATRLRTDVLRAITVDPRKTSPHELNLKLASLISQNMRGLGDSEGAKRICVSAYRESAKQLQDYADHRTLTRLVAALEAEFGRCELDLGDLAAAESHFRSSLERLRNSFVFDGTPKEFSFAYMGGDATHDQIEPEAYVQFALTQSSLAEVLRFDEKHEEAYALADESVRTCILLIGLFPQLHDYRVDAARCGVVWIRCRATNEQQANTRDSLLLNIVDELRPLVNTPGVPKSYVVAYTKLATAMGQHASLVPADGPPTGNKR